MLQWRLKIPEWCNQDLAQLSTYIHTWNIQTKPQLGDGSVICRVKQEGGACAKTSSWLWPAATACARALPTSPCLIPTHLFGPFLSSPQLLKAHSWLKAFAIMSASIHSLGIHVVHASCRPLPQSPLLSKAFVRSPSETATQAVATESFPHPIFLSSSPHALVYSTFHLSALLIIYVAKYSVSSMRAGGFVYAHDNADITMRLGLNTDVQNEGRATCHTQSMYLTHLWFAWGPDEWEPVPYTTGRLWCHL